MKKLTLYLFFLICSFSGFAEVIQVDITGESCFNPEFDGNTFVYTGEIIAGPSFPCGSSWEYRVVGGQIINVIQSNGNILPQSPGTTAHAGTTNDVDQVTIQWLTNNSCNSVEFIGKQEGFACLNREQDSKTLNVQTGFISNPSVSIQGPENISCGSNEFSLNIDSGCNEYTSFVWRISGEPNVITISPNVNLMVNNCPGNFEISVTATGSCTSFTYEQGFTCTGLGKPEPVINMEDSYCCRKDVVLNTAGTNGEEGYVITICQTELPGEQDCINWRGTGWQTGEVDLNVDLLDIWNKNGESSWLFWKGYHYRVMLAVYNECDSWEAVTHTFTVTGPDPYFEINDANGDPVPDNGMVYKCNRNGTMNSSLASCGDEYRIMICRTNEPGGENCLGWRSTEWQTGDVSDISPIDLLSIWNKNGESSWLFWSGYSYRVSLVLRSECDSWEGYSQTFTVGGDCFTDGSGGEESSGGGANDRSDALAQEALDKEIQIYPTLINSSIDYLNVIVPQASLNTSLLLYDVQGRVIQKNQINESSSAISISELGSGLYFAILYEDGKQIHQSKLVISK